MSTVDRPRLVLTQIASVDVYNSMGNVEIGGPLTGTFTLAKQQSELRILNASLYEDKSRA
jgi:hypothetical protein